jgi:hypothetical protein
MTCDDGASIIVAKFKCIRRALDMIIRSIAVPLQLAQIGVPHPSTLNAVATVKSECQTGDEKLQALAGQAKNA